MGRPSSCERDAAFRAAVADAKERHNLSDVVGRRTTLKRRGPREMVGLCPFHLEKTPSFEVNDAKGTYHCHGCGAGGDAIRFLMTLDRLTFVQALEALIGGAFPIVSVEERAKQKAADERETIRRRDLARDIWSESVPAAGSLASVYARSRGITAPLPPTIRFVTTPRWYDPETGAPGRAYPAMACALQDSEGAIVGVQCVYLRRDGGAKLAVDKPKLTWGIIVGSALRLGPVAEHVTICEGTEDGLSLMQSDPDRSVWVACGTALMSRVVLPASVSEITLAGDNGGAGHKAVDEATIAYMGQGLAVNETFPPSQFKDWNDQLRGIAC